MEVDPMVVGAELAALGLIAGAVLLALTGAVVPLGCSFRTTVEPLLRRLRHRSTLSRDELADLTILVGVALAVAATVVGQSPFGVLFAGGLWLARPAVKRATREENRVAAVAGHVSIDLVIGLYTPIMLAQFLLANVLLGGSLLAVVVGLSWPAGGGGSPIPGRRWRLAPVTS